jgi:hypothetical protein
MWRASWTAGATSCTPSRRARTGTTPKSRRCSPGAEAAPISVLQGGHVLQPFQGERLRRPDGELSFARVGDDRWTHITRQTLRWVSGYRDAVYNEIDGLFYVLSFDGSMNTLDLGDPFSPVSKDMMIPWDDPIKDLMLTPSGEVLQVCGG